jgi:hypothetical protein
MLELGVDSKSRAVPAQEPGSHGPKSDGGDDPMPAPACVVLLGAAGIATHSKVIGLLPLTATPGPGAGASPGAPSKLGVVPKSNGAVPARMSHVNGRGQKRCLEELPRQTLLSVEVGHITLVVIPHTRGVKICGPRGQVAARTYFTKE